MTLLEAALRLSVWIDDELLNELNDPSYEPELWEIEEAQGCFLKSTEEELAVFRKKAYAAGLPATEVERRCNELWVAVCQAQQAARGFLEFRRWLRQNPQVCAGGRAADLLEKFVGWLKYDAAAARGVHWARWEVLNLVVDLDKFPPAATAPAVLLDLDTTPPAAAPPDAVTPEAVAPAAVPTPGRGRMTVEDANHKAKELAKQLGKAFFALSENEQAKKIGCSWTTWSRTELYKTAREMKDRSRLRGSAGRPPASPPVVSLTDNLEDVAVQGGRNPVLDSLAEDELATLVAESQAENAADPSPTDPGPKKVYLNKRW
jgi:hypothetical protein